MRILVTGGCGFVGSAVVRMAIERGDSVLNLDRRRKSAPVPALGPTAQREGYARLESDIADRSMLRAVLREFAPNSVIHLATSIDETSETLVDAEIGEAFSVLEASRLYFERLTGEARARFRIVRLERGEGDAGGPLTRAEAARGAAGALMDRWARAHGLPLVACAAGEAFGPWQPQTSFFAQLLTSLLYRQGFTLPDGGETVRDWLPVRDLAAGLLCAAERGQPLGRYDLSVGAERRDIDLAEAICAILDERAPHPSGAPWSTSLALGGEPSQRTLGPMLDAEDAERELGWAPLGFYAGLERMMSWAIASHAAARQRQSAIAAE